MKQTSSSLLMVRPSHFGFNKETAGSNSFQTETSFQNPEKEAIIEFNNAMHIFQNAGIRIIAFNDRPSDQTPDAIFPNNWVSFHENGKVILYPMEAINRRRERRQDLIERLSEEYGFKVSEIINLSDYEKHLKFLEGTGSIVFDHPNRKAYVALSARSHTEPLQKLADLLEYQPHTFHTTDYTGNPIYHTNVMMSIGNHFAVVCASCIPNKNERNTLIAGLENNSKELIEITGQQMASFAGNMLEVCNSREEPLLLLSETAIKSLTSKQVKSLEKYGSLIPVSIPVIERIGGGSIRCMVAEIFLPESSNLIRFKIVQPQSNSDFEKYYGLRWRVLREPWNQPEGSEKDDLEDTSIHRMAVGENGLMAGVARLHYLNETEAQIRFMAVAPEFQGKGAGKILIESLELEAKKSGRKRVFLQARENAVPFYLRLGYSIIEKTFLLYEQIQHYSMEKEV